MINEQFCYNGDLIKLSDNVFDYQHEMIVGRNRDIDLGASGESIWEPGGLYPWSSLTSPVDVEVLSSSASDSALGVGAQILTIIGLDANYDVITDAINLSGTTPVNAGKKFLRINDAFIIRAGSTGVNVGNITIRIKTVLTTIGYIASGQNKQFSANRTVPRNQTCYVLQGTVNLNRDIDAQLDIVFKIRQYGMPWLSAMYMGCSVYGGPFHFEFKKPLKIPSRTDIDVIGVDARETDEDVSVIYEVVYV